jgi:hypothetical protein
MEAVELVICWICNEEGPCLGIDSGGMEPELVRAGWRFEDGWVCSACLDGGTAAQSSP